MDGPFKILFHILLHSSKYDINYFKKEYRENKSVRVINGYIFLEGETYLTEIILPRGYYLVNFFYIDIRTL